jgi:lipid II:glycine glycyltransferase (peptidoglycan interpeptide bridge formation enzyme)
MQVLVVDENRKEEWNDFISLESSFGLMQSWEWGEFKKDFNWTPFRIAVEHQGKFVCAALLLVKRFPLIPVSLAYIPRGPIGNWIADEPRLLLFSEIHRVSKLNQVVFLKIEPSLQNNITIDELLKRDGFLSNSETNQPRASIILDLTPSSDELLAGMRKKTRKYIREAAENGIKVRLGGPEDFPVFYNLMAATARREGFPLRTSDYYEKEWLAFYSNNQAALLLAYYNDEPLVARIVYRFGKHAAAFHSGSSHSHSELHPNNLLVWEAILWAKKLGCETYDLWGIPDEVGQMVFEGKEPPVEERTDGLWGVYRFKSGFSKNIVYFLGAYDFVYNRLIYRLMTNRILNARTLERISAWLDALGKRNL